MLVLYRNYVCLYMDLVWTARAVKHLPPLWDLTSACSGMSARVYAKVSRKPGGGGGGGSFPGLPLPLTPL